MRFIGFAEGHSKDAEAATAFNRDIVQAERKKYPDRYPNKFLPDHNLTGPLPKLKTDMCTVAFYEPTEPKQLSNIRTRWMPLGDISFVPVTTEDAGWRFLAFGQFSSKDLEEILARNTNVIQAERKKYPERYPKKFLEDHSLVSPLPTLTRDWCTLAFYETDDPKQIANLTMRWMPMIKFSFVQVVPSTVTLESWKAVAGK